MKKYVLTIAAVCACLTIGVRASSLSPAIGILSKRMEMKRCITQNNDFYFAENGIEKYFGENAASVTAEVLPEASSGTLYCGSFAVKEGQKLSGDSLSMLKFSPKSEFCGTAEMTFASGEKKLYCSILVTEGENKPPVTGKQSLTTQKNITLVKAFSAADPENDRLEYEIVKYPSKGNVSINNEDGTFVYRPQKDYLGRDSFSYRATDVFGNSSKTSVVEIKVSKPSCDKYFSDMENHWAHNSAVKMASTGLMTGNEVDGKLVFEPEKAMTRGDFLALTLICSGLEGSIPYTDETSFADDEKIPSNIKSYAEYAYQMCIVKGYPSENGEVCFKSSGNVTRAEAAVIAEKVLELVTSENDKQTETASFTDAAAIPVWAGAGIERLSALGILKGSPSGKINAENLLTKAEGAEMLCNVADYVESRNKEKEKEEKKFFFGIFDIFKK